MSYEPYEVDFSHYKFFKVERAGKVLTITFNKPETLNAIDTNGHRELARIFTDATEDETTEVIVVTGAGRAFSAGGDLDFIESMHDDHMCMQKGAREARRVVFSMLDCDKPVIAKVNGDAVGLGATVALLCDVVIATDTARFGDPHNCVGLIAGDGGIVTWPQMFGYARAKHYLLTGELIPAKEAETFGLIYKAVLQAELDATVDAYVQKLLKMPIQSVRWTKQVMNIPLSQIAHSVMDAGIAYEGMGARTDDLKEWVNAFREKRKPAFKHR